MKKIVLSILFFLVFICPIFALDFSVYESRILEDNGSYSFTLALESIEDEQLFIFFLKESNEDSAIWACVGDCFVSNVDYAFFPVSYTTSEENITGDVVFDTPILLYEGTDEAIDFSINYYGLLGYHQVDFLTALLNDGFVLFETLNLSTNNLESKKYFNITDNSGREEALKTFNRFMNYFY